MATSGTFGDFLGALLAFESGWDRDRYETGEIADWQLDSWAGGAVGDFFPAYSSWGDLTDAEWETMAYRSTNALGFVGFQFGEALLIDLGYYEDDVYYGNGAATNTWDGTWTGKNGATSLDAFMTREVQDQAILDAFGYNLGVIETGLAQGGESLNDYLGETFTYYDNGAPVEVTLTLTGVLAAAHLRGAWGTLSLLQSGTVSTDEYGTSILKYVEQFGGYDAPSVQALIAGYETGADVDTGAGQGTGDHGGTGDAGDAGGDNGADDGGIDDGGAVVDAGDGFGTAGVTAATADVVINWSWGANAVISDFDPDSSTVFVAWIGADQLEVTETDAGVQFSIPSNQQTILLEGVSLTDLSQANFTFLDATAGSEVFAAIAAAGGSTGGDAGGDDGSTGDGSAGDGTGDGSTDDDTGGGTGTGDETGGDAGVGDDTGDGSDDGAGDGTAGGTGSDGGTADPAVYAFTWNWGARQTVEDFDPDTDQIDLSALWTSYESFTIGSDADGNAVIDLTAINNQTITLAGVDADALSAANFLGVSGAWLGATGDANDTGGTGDTDGSGPADGTADGGVDADDGIAVGLVLVDSWGDTFHFKATVENVGDTALEDWSFDLDTEMELVSSWGVEAAESDEGFALSNVGWNGDLAGGQSAEVGFIVSGDLDFLV